MEITTSLEQQLLAAMLKDRTSYDLFNRIGNREAFSPLGRTTFGAISEFFDLDPNARSCSRELIQERLLSRITNDKHIAPIKDYLHNLREDVSVTNVEFHVRELHRRQIGTKLSLALANGAPQEEVAHLIGEYRAGATVVHGNEREASLVDVLCTDDLTNEDKSNHVNYIRLWPKQLNDRLDGGALRGHHVLLFARPETGKTLMAINLCAGFLHQRLNVLYLCNEEPVADIRDRIRGRLLKTSKSLVRGQREESARRLSEMALGTLRITEGTSFQGVRALLGSVAARDPWDVVVLDQVRNMRLKSDSRTAELEAAGIEARAIAKDFNVLVVSVTQAGDSATNKVFIDMSDIDSSKTGLPASADLIIGLGADSAMRANGLLGVSLSKNKISGDHAQFTVSVNYASGVVE